MRGTLSDNFLSNLGAEVYGGTVKFWEVQWAYQVLGDGPIDLVFHHGFCHLDLQWDIAAEAAFNRRLASFSRLILFDRRGAGASERLHRGAAPTVDEWTADLLAVLDAVESESAALFVEAEAGPVAIKTSTPSV